MPETKSLVDVQFALSQLSGNADLLSRMLVKFVIEFSPVPADVKKYIEDGELQEARLKVHTTKGLTGNLGLMALFECTKLLDQQIRNGQIDNTQLDAFERLMQETCEMIENINLDTIEKAPFEENSKGQELSYKVEFMEKLKRNEFIDDETLHKYINSLALDSSVKNKLRELVEELQYAKAIEIIS